MQTPCQFVNVLFIDRRERTIVDQACGMIQRKERLARFARGQHPAVRLANGDFCIRDRLQGNVAQCHNHLRRDYRVGDGMF